ncbi:MAG: LytR C-terminal domain-containing protein, partial [Ignavibacteriae bacterium]|nr:LytR C-terminal domain-containing protein [Ignavibacteriota bacterium]
MDTHTEIPTEQPSAPANTSGKKMLLFLLNIVIAVLLVATGYFGHKFFDRYFPPKQPAQVIEQKKEPPRPTEVLQIDVLNGCGEKGVASRFTNFLRSKGYDVVEMKNYKTSSIPRTLVIDRMGNMQPARDIAEPLRQEGGRRHPLHVVPERDGDAAAVVRPRHRVLPARGFRPGRA